MMTRKEAADMLGISDQSVSNWIKEGILNGKVTKKSTLVDKGSVTKFFDTLQEIAQMEKTIAETKKRLQEEQNGLQRALTDFRHAHAIYNLAALLSVVAESKPRLAWRIGIDGLWNVLEVARENQCAVFTPSSIGSFGQSTPHLRTPQDTIQRPQTIYGVSKVTTELLSDYFQKKYGTDTRSVRFPGIISYVTPPGGGTTDYAVDIFYSAVRGERFVCPIKAGTMMDMMYMPDALKAAITIMEADPSRLVHHNSFNVTAMSFAPETIFAEIKKHRPQFEMVYDIDPLKQSIAESWPDKMDDTCARREWGWSPDYDLRRMTIDMLAHLEIKLLRTRGN